MLPIMLYVYLFYFKEFNYNDILSISPSIFIKRNIDIDIILLYYWCYPRVFFLTLDVWYIIGQQQIRNELFSYSSAGLKQASEIIIVGCIPANDRRKISWGREKGRRDLE